MLWKLPPEMKVSMPTLDRKLFSKCYANNVQNKKVFWKLHQKKRCFFKALKRWLTFVILKTLSHIFYHQAFNAFHFTSTISIETDTASLPFLPFPINDRKGKQKMFLIKKFPLSYLSYMILAKNTQTSWVWKRS